MSPTELDPMSLSLAELRAMRTDLQNDDDAVSYARRLVQVRIDMVAAEQRSRAQGTDIDDELVAILGTQLSGGAPRPPRPANDFSHHPHAVELDQLCARFGATDIGGLTDDELSEFSELLVAFERARSAERRELFGRIDALSAELVRRYRDGEASVDGLLADD